MTGIFCGEKAFDFRAIEGVGCVMKITADVFEAFLKCPTKCWLRASAELDSGNAYAAWVKSQTTSFRTTQIERILSETAKDDCMVSPQPEKLKTDKWRLV